MPSERDLVLAEPDLAARLTKQPLGFARPEQWSGYIPPYMVPDGTRHIRNDSPQRAILVGLVATAIGRRDGEAAARAWTKRINTDRWTPTWMPSPDDAIKRAAQIFDRSIPDWS